MATAESVDEYLAGLPVRERKTLAVVRDAIRSAAPEAEEKISYRIPMYVQDGHLVGFAAFKRHLSLFVTNSAVGEEFADELEPFEVNHTTIRFTTENPLPADLIERIVRLRLRENEQRARAKR